MVRNDVRFSAWLQWDATHILIRLELNNPAGMTANDSANDKTKGGWTAKHYFSIRCPDSGGDLVEGHAALRPPVRFV